MSDLSPEALNYGLFLKVSLKTSLFNRNVFGSYSVQCSVYTEYREDKGNTSKVDATFYGVVSNNL